MERRNVRISRIASALAAAGGLVSVLYLVARTADLATPEAVLAVAGALAPTLAILVAWWLPARSLRAAMLAVAMLLELPALVIAGSALALAIEALLFVAVVASLWQARPPAPRRYSIVF